MKLTNWNPDERVVIKKVQGVNKTTFEVYARLPNGKVIRQRFNKETDAIPYAEDLKIEGLNLQNAKIRNVRPTSLGATQESDYITAIEILNKKFGDGAWNLTKAATWVAANYQEQDWTNVHVVDAIAEFLDWKKKEGAKKNYLDKFKTRLGLRIDKKGIREVKAGSFASIDKLLNDVTQAELDHLIWDESWEVTNSTRLDTWKHLHHFYNWASSKKPKKCQYNPIVDIPKPPKNELDPQAFTVEQATKIMETAASAYNGDTVPYFALALFAGLRPQEITGNESIKPLRWDEHFVWDKDDNGVDKVSIRLRGKMAWRRTVLLPDNCLAWIKPYAKKRGTVCPKNFEKKYDVIRCAAGFRVSSARIYGIDKRKIDGLQNPDDKKKAEWIQDGCRHSALSYRLAIVEDIQGVCSWAGNSPRTFKSNYEALVTKEQAKKYWAIFPPMPIGQ